MLTNLLPCNCFPAPNVGQRHRHLTQHRTTAKGFSRYGKANEHNGRSPHDHWLEDWEREAVIRFHHEDPLEGYRRLTFMVLDLKIVAVTAPTLGES
jgi:hypothetical protein